MADVAKSDKLQPNAGQSCRECRRRKGKCDGKMPVCSVCQRYNRHCLYDKHSRSSLTRKHLTEVEERLEKAEALLRTFFTEAELSQMLIHGVSHGPEASPQRPIAQSSLSNDAAFPGSRSALQKDTTNHPSNQPVPTASPDPDQKFDFHVFDSSRSPASESGAAFENLPGADDDFEWDERDPSWNLGELRGGGASTLQNDPDSDVPKITDGMATLTTDDSHTGFYGSVSGAALLRLIWMGNAGEGSDDKSEFHKQRRQTMEQLMKDTPEDNSLPSSWLQTQPLITRQVVDSMVDAYFAYYHPTFPILHQSSFRQQYSKMSGRPGGNTFHILVNLVATLGAFVSRSGTDDTHATLFNAVKANLTIVSLETGSLSLVQAFAMAATYLQKRNRPNSGYNYGGIALRLATSLGLHKEFHGWQATPFKKEVRRRVWWSLCVLDVGATVTYGRPLNWPQVGVETAFPLNIHEQDLEPTSTSFPPEVHETTLYTYITTQSQYHLRTIPIYNRLISNPLPSAAELISLDDELVGGWLAGLPEFYNDRDLPLSNEYLLGHGIARWRYRRSLVGPEVFLAREYGAVGGTNRHESLLQGRRGMHLVYFPILVDRNSHQTGGLVCTLYNPTNSPVPSTRYFLLQAALIPIHCLRRIPGHADAPSWRKQVITALNVINAMTNLNSSATKCRDIIYRLCGESLVTQQRSQSFSHHNQPQQQQPHPRQDSWSSYATEPNFAQGFPPFPTGDSSDAGLNPWMTEIDTAIDGYDVYINRLSNAAMAGMGNVDQPPSDNAAGMLSTDGTEIGTGVQDWDWNLMLT
ncbi:hypothetical protein PV08_06829 [Exophiala spinifera]|uniref:Zn(2)-C6 fungal-type domain-containing protein n=1 Tax=Exophiala spinifera TaxID=91928 RepID=A0A0D2B588_9EURO|nr:uncharacterized protein PV08_06829 [Exophiala spinifera]KIW14048.1 hypothetical protein PV08_06829 [Exophiala spinifera]